MTNLGHIRSNWGIFCLFMAMILVVVIMCSGCSVFRHVDKSSQQTQTTDKSVITEKSKSTELDTRKETKKIDTVVYDKADSSMGSKPASDVIAGKYLKIETEGSEAIVSYDKVSGNLELKVKTKADSHKVLMDETTETSKVKTDTTSKQQLNNIATASKTELKTVETKMRISLIIPVIVLIVVIFILWLLNKRFGFITKIFKP